MKNYLIGNLLQLLTHAAIVRSGEISREQAIKDLEFIPPMELIKELASEVGTDIYLFKNKK